MGTRLQNLEREIAAKQTAWQKMWDSKPARDFSNTEIQELKQLTTELGAMTAERDQMAHLEAAAKSIGARPGTATYTGSGIVYGDMPSADPTFLDSKGFSGRAPNDENLSIGRYIKALISGDWSQAPAELKAMGTATGGAGGYLVPRPLAAQVLDLARAKTRVMEAGATIVPMESSTLRVAKIAGDPSPAWHVENASDVQVEDATIGAVEFTARTLPIIVKISRELVEDGQGVDAAISMSLAGAFALELDRVALFGSGTAPEPRGLANTPGLSTIVQGTGNGAKLTSYAPLVAAIGDVWSRNFEPTAGILSPRELTTLAQLITADGQPAQPPPVVDKLPWLMTNQVPTSQTVGTSTNASSIFVGDWSKLLIGVRSTFQIELLKEKYVDSWSYAFSASLRADIQVADIGAFCEIQGIVPA